MQTKISKLILKVFCCPEALDHLSSLRIVRAWQVGEIFHYPPSLVLSCRLAICPIATISVALGMTNARQ